MTLLLVWVGGQPNLARDTPLEADRLSDEDDVDPAERDLPVDLENLPDEAVLPVGCIRASILELQAVLDDLLACPVQGSDELLRADGRK
jgi:hypothetical protein